ncbi:hypothetical protein AMATHDRAFT_60364 [Amanita thiersii Skay4041]|uniref:BTB domain-containing protein n=1 Tax=Amanita thiersii Skay4041 TaxID=703135 RepID=A0A2A9NT34_9AGAR|nr:hypothetical protein AMATHDRAFT_60364 [Amanita thiersii Skay4041]
MFQVASHPAAFGLHPHGQYPSSSNYQSPAVKLPRNLARPPFVDISRDAILAVAPELENVPTEYIRRGLRPKANVMLAGIAALAPSHLPSALPRSHIPQSLTIPVRSTSEHPEFPTHIIALSSSTSSSNDQLRLFPVHSLVLASHCARLPRIPPSTVTGPSSTQLTLPILPMSLPSPAAFTILHQFMYYHRLDSVLKALFPLPQNFLHSLSHHTVQATLRSEGTLRQLSSYLCASASSNLQTLTSHAAHVKELWQDMAALGLYDPELWDTIDLAWEIVLGALNLAASGN